MDRWHLARDGDEIFLWYGGYPSGVEVPETGTQLRWPCKRPLQRHLLIQQHADQHGGAVGVEQVIRLWITGDVHVSRHAGQPTDLPRLESEPPKNGGRPLASTQYVIGD